MSLLRTIMEHSSLSLSGGGSNSSNHADNTQTSVNGNTSTNSATPTTNTSTPVVTTTGTTRDPAIIPLAQTSNTNITNTQSVSAELIAIRNSKEQQRRRERRERRIRRQRRGAGGLLPIPTPEQLQHYYHHNLAYGGGTFDPYSINAIYGSNGEYGFNCNAAGNGANMPDILNTHVSSGSAAPPPPYSTLPGQRTSASSRMPPSVVHRPPHVTSPSRSGRGWRHAIFPANRSANNRRSQPLFMGGGYEDENGGGGLGRMDKSCCGVIVTQTVSIRWFIVMIAFVGICCSVVGTVLGAMKASGREHLTVSLLMIGVGIVLITVSGIAWRLTSTDAPSCRAMLGLGGGIDGDDCNGRFLTRATAMAGAAAAVSYGRPQHPYAAMMYSDFNYRPPPPSYQASMQEYRLRLLLLDRGHPNHNTLNSTNAVTAETRAVSATNDRAHQQQMLQQGGVIPPAISHPPASGQNPTIGNLSPPPAYRSHLRTAMANAMVHSRPPSYRSHNSDHEVVIPQPCSSNVNERDQPFTSGNQLMSTTAQINATDDSPVEHISNADNSMAAESASDMAQRTSNSTLDDTRVVSSHTSFPHSSTRFHNISTVNCHTGSSVRQPQEACINLNKDGNVVNVVVNSTSFPNAPAGDINTTTKKENRRDCREHIRMASHIDEAFEVTNSAAELMKGYSSQSSKSDVWQLLPSLSNPITHQNQPKSLPIPQPGSLSPQFLQDQSFDKNSTTGRKIVNLFNGSRHAEGGVSENVVANTSMDSSSVLSHASTATSASSSFSSSRPVTKDKDTNHCHNNHSSLVTIIHHQKSSSDYEESDCEQSSFAYSRLSSEGGRYEGANTRNDECKRTNQHSYGHAQNHFKDIVTVSSGHVESSYKQQSGKPRDNNYQILSVAGMHALGLEQNEDTKQVCESFENDRKMDDCNHTSSSTSSSGQQVQFLAHL